MSSAPPWLDAIVATTVDDLRTKIGPRGVLVLTWGAEDSCYRTNVKPEILPGVLRALAEKLAPIRKDGTSQVLVKEDGSTVEIPPDHAAREAVAAEKAAAEKAAADKAATLPQLHEPVEPTTP